MDIFYQDCFPYVRWWFITEPGVDDKVVADYMIFTIEAIHVVQYFGQKEVT